MRYIGIIILLVLCLTLLLLTGCIVNTVIPETAIGNLENQENIEEPVIEEPADATGTANPQKWSGLGMMIFGTDVANSVFDNWVDTLMANGFTELRVDVSDTVWVENLERSKASVIRTVAKGAKVIWGVCHGNSAITADNWAAYRQEILDNAQWAQDNGVYEFQIGNEEECYVDETKMTVAQIITNLKDVAKDVKKIFTNGKISYSCDFNSIDDWIAIGKGDIDILASNIYRGGNGYYGDEWKTAITNLVNAFGTNGTYLTEFGLSWSSLDDYSTDEEIQAAGVTEMIEYIKASGMERAIYFSWKDGVPSWLGNFGVVKDDGTYRKLWNQALLNSGSIKSITVPTKTATISSPNTISLMLK